MEDRKLLEFAAKAAEMHNMVWWEDMECYQIPGDVPAKLWNPLRDDGDALRLAVKLGMEVYIDNHPDGCECTEAQSHTYSEGGRSVYSFTPAMDQYEATRRAIVRTAASIGKTIK